MKKVLICPSERPRVRLLAQTVPLVQVALRLSNQDGEVVVDCTAEVELPV